MIYLDHNATTDIYPEVINKIMNFYYKPLNASAVHSYGREAKKILETARGELARLIAIENSSSYRIIFTSSGTEANNLLMSNFLDGDIFISGIEHSSILAYSKIAKNVQLLDVTKEGVVRLEHLTELLAASKARKKLVSVMLANNETGAIQPLQEIAKIAKQFGALTHSDLVQAIGKIKISLPELNIDFASISAHKFGGPAGAGALIARDDYNLNPLIIGGGQEKNLRAGTENIIAIAGFGKAAEIVRNEVSHRYNYLRNLQIKLEKVLLENSNIEIVSKNVNRLPNTTLIINRGKKAEIQLIAFDLKGVALSSGAACSSGKVAPSKVLSAMGYLEQDAKSAIRISTGMSTTMTDIDNFLRIYNEINKHN